MKKEQLSQIIKTARDIMRKDDNLSTDLDRIPQFSWLLFLKCFDDLEQRRALLNKKHKDAIESPYRWRDWAADENKGKTGDDLIKFVNDELFPYLRELVGEGQNDSRDVIASLFKETFNRMRSGYLLRELVNLVNKINFNLKDDVHTMAHFYESMLKEMRDAAGTNGEFYTPRPVIRFIVEQVNPKLGETVYDPAAGTCGFLVEAYQHMLNQVKSAEDLEKLRYHTLYGTEKKPMPFLLGMMNLLLHDLDSPNLIRANTLSIPLKEITDKQRYDVIITNPPFGGEEEKGILDNFPLEMRTSETILLFIQFIMRSLKINGRCGIVLPNSFLFGNGVFTLIKKELLSNFNLHTIVKLPAGVFTPYTTTPTNLLFFEKTGATKKIWYYELDSPQDLTRGYTKTRPLLFEELIDCKTKWKKKEVSNNSWIVSVNKIIERDYNLDISNPNKKKRFEYKSPLDVFNSYMENLKNIKEEAESIRDFLRIKNPEYISFKKLNDICDIQPGFACGNKSKNNGFPHLRMQNVDQNGNIDLSLLWYVPLPKEKIKKYFLRKGDIIFNNTNSAELLGKTAVFYLENNKYVFSNHMTRLRLSTDEVLPEWISIYIQYLWHNRFFEKNCVRWINQASFNKQRLKDVMVPIPSINNQKEIIETIKKLSKSIKQMRTIKEKSKNKLNSLIPIIFGQLFREVQI